MSTGSVLVALGIAAPVVVFGLWLSAKIAYAGEVQRRLLHSWHRDVDINDAAEAATGYDVEVTELW